MAVVLKSGLTKLFLYRGLFKNSLFASRKSTVLSSSKGTPSKISPKDLPELSSKGTFNIELTD